jgi:hypothetical protein
MVLSGHGVPAVVVVRVPRAAPARQVAGLPTALRALRTGARRRVPLLRTGASYECVLPPASVRAYEPADGSCVPNGSDRSVFFCGCSQAATVAGLGMITISETLLSCVFMYTYLAVSHSQSPLCIISPASASRSPACLIAGLLWCCLSLKLPSSHRISFAASCWAGPGRFADAFWLVFASLALLCSSGRMWAWTSACSTPNCDQDVALRDVLSQ